MKKIFIVLLAFVLALSFMACKNSKDVKDKNDETASKQEEKQETNKADKVELTEENVKKYIEFFPKFIEKAQKEGLAVEKNNSISQAQTSNSEINNFIADNGWESENYFYNLHTKMSQAASWVMLQGKIGNVPAAARKQMESQMNASLSGFSDSEKQVLKKYAPQLSEMYMSLAK